MLQLSDYLNDTLDFTAGEDFGKLAEHPRPTPPQADENDLCRTDRKSICSHLDWMCRYLQQQDRLSTVGENKIRLLKRLIEKLGKDGKQ